MDFDSFARQYGVLLPAHLYPSQKIRRCATVEHPRARNGAFFYDGERGWVRAWDMDGDTHWWNDPHAKPATARDRERMAIRARVERARKESIHARAVARAQELLDTCFIEPHAYLAGKGLPEAEALVTEDYALFIPMRHIDSQALLGGQVIQLVPETVNEDGEVIRAHFGKKMIYGTRLAGASYVMGAGVQGRETWFCEGYATGLSLMAAIKSMNLHATVIVCFNDWNLIQVARQVQGRRFVFADNDRKGAGERAAQATGLPYCMSPEVGEDANDLHQRAGLLAVTALMMKTRTRRG